MEPISATNLTPVLDVYGPEREALLELLSGLAADDWAATTECPAYPVKGIATHILGDDLSLLSRQRDAEPPGLLLYAENHPGLDFRQLLDGFNDQWVEAARFLSPPMLIELLRLAGEWTEAYYREVDPLAACEPVPLFGPEPGETSFYWQAIAREYLERWAHHSQIRRAVGMSSLDGAPFLEVGTQIVATVAGGGADVSEDGVRIGSLDLGSRTQAGEILTLAHDWETVAAMVDGPEEDVVAFAFRVGRRDSS